MTHNITLPMTRFKTAALSAGDSVTLSGVIYTARDAAHLKLVTLIAAGEPLPFPIEDSTIYYVGPAPARPGEVIGSAGPTTSYRMDSYSPELLRLGHRAMIGKGERSDEVIAAMIEAGAVYLGAIGGAGALLAGCVVESEVIAFPELGAEAIRRLVVRDFPAQAVIDSRGGNLYRDGRAAYLASLDTGA